MHNEFTAVIAPAPAGGYAAYCLEIPAVGEEETLEECRQNLREAILLMLTDRCETECKEAPPINTRAPVIASRRLTGITLQRESSVHSQEIA
jgi:predicted RNase H-like HicB family nuclease